MTQRSGVFTKYVVAFLPTGLTVSSDARAGDLCLDAHVRVRMSRGLSGTAFEIRLYDLPETRSRALAESFPAFAGDGVPLPRVRIQLGYLDTEMAPVLEGVCEHVHSGIEGDRAVTVVRGRETATWACAITPCPHLDSLPGTPGALVARLLAQAALPPDCVDPSPLLCGPLPERLPVTLPGNLPGLRPGAVSGPHPGAASARESGTALRLLSALEEVAVQCGCELLVVDGRVCFGRAPQVAGADAKVLDRSVNLALFEPFTLAVAGPDDAAEGGNDSAGPGPATRVSGFRFKVLGDPTLRPGAAVHLAGVDRGAGLAWAVRHLDHRYSSADGYVCTGVAALPLADGHLARQVDLLTEHNAAAAARAVISRLRRQATQPARAPS